MKILKENTVGLIIDLQERLIPVISKRKKIIDNTRKLIAGLNELSVPLIVSQQYTKGIGMTIPEISELINNFAPIEKTSFSCFGEPAFVERLNNTKAKNILICGIELHICVLQTAIDLKEAGFNPIIVLDCVSSRQKQSMRIAIERLRFEGIMITSMESVLFELIKDSMASEFKAISKIIK